MAVLNIYTQEFFWDGKAKRLAKRLFGRDFGGPAAVARSLCLGLDWLKTDYAFNKLPVSGATAGVLSGVKTLAWAIEQKRKGKIKKILAGPNLVVTPLEAGGILQDPAIDVVVVPSGWVKDHYTALAPSLAGRVEVWPAGVTVPPEYNGSKKYDVLIYNKLKDESLVKTVAACLASRHQNFYRLDYGNFRQKDYFRLLNESRALVYLSESESQGIAMFEAWARGVPSLVWERGFFAYRQYHVTAKAASGYVTPEVGMTFSGSEDFLSCYENFCRQNFQPRQFVLKNYSNERSAERYLRIAGF